MNEHRRAKALKTMTNAILVIGREHQLLPSELIDVVAKTLAAMTEAALTEPTIPKAALTPAGAALLSQLRVGVGTPDESSPYLYFFRASDKTYFRYLGSEIKAIDSSQVPFCTWAPAEQDSFVAQKLIETAPNVL